LDRNKKKVKLKNSSKRFKINIVLEKKYIDREKSWLAFNARVLQEAADDLPLLDRLRFLEFFQIMSSI
jgi:polyphosphate kinase